MTTETGIETTHGTPYRHRSGVTVRAPIQLAEQVDLTTLTKADLVDVAVTAGLDTTGTKAELLERLENTDG